LPSFVISLETAMNHRHPQTPTPTGRDEQPDGRDGRTVGDTEDGALESLGKAIVAPVEGADEDADTNPDRPFEDLTRTLPKGEEAAPDATPKARR
jgi:hypothetical protein